MQRLKIFYLPVEMQLSAADACGKCIDVSSFRCDMRHNCEEMRNVETALRVIKHSGLI